MINIKEKNALATMHFKYENKVINCDILLNKQQRRKIILMTAMNFRSQIPLYIVTTTKWIDRLFTNFDV